MIVVPDANDSVTTESKVVEITYTSDGFSPRETTVSAGTKVTFYNRSGTPMWVASNVHPTHTDYSAFDQLSIGDTYTFTFTEPGIYNYHNHLAPRNNGKIIVK
jgi:plastocyanin